MPKKTFLENPALRFLSLDSYGETPDKPNTPETSDRGVGREEKTVSDVNTSVTEEEVADTSVYSLSVTPKPQIKSRRVQLIMQPDLYQRIKKKATENGLSVNDFCHRILEQATKEV